MQYYALRKRILLSYFNHNVLDYRTAFKNYIRSIKSRVKLLTTLKNCHKQHISIMKKYRKQRKLIFQFDTVKKVH